ncbi:MAG: hypothetical protein CL685_03800 [Candidatus Magasanikbacteria bacterium]|nr:hypothetical protein [Candidatus Magasanikbacteria bacterium]
MKLIERYLNTHHLFHKPHKWFLAFLVSPIHALEMHYKKKYHISFRHAKKLFFFDMLLLFSTIFLFAGTLFWHFYDRTVLELVSVDIAAQETRIQSGSHTTYTISFANNSDMILTNAHIAVSLPDGFILDTAQLDTRFSAEQQLFTLQDVLPGSSGNMQIAGWFYAIPNKENTITATLSYKQEGRKQTEVKARHALAILRDSVLRTSVSVSDTLLGSGTTPIEIHIENTGDQPLQAIQLPFFQTDGLQIQQTETDYGSASEYIWAIPELAPNNTATLRGKLVSTLNPSITQIDTALTPEVFIAHTYIPQQTVPLNFTVLHPGITVQPAWQNAVPHLLPKEKPVLDVSITNTGNTPLSQITLHLPLQDESIDVVQFVQENSGILTRNQAFIVNSTHNAALSTLAPGKTTTLSFTIPIRANPKGSHNALQLQPKVEGVVAILPTTRFSATKDATLKTIGSTMVLSADVRYFTKEGDQLGRGPLPPKIGKETKYWGSIRITNGGNTVNDVRFTAKLPPYVHWPGRVSVSKGEQVIYNTKNNTISWQYSGLAPREFATIHMQLGLTPNESLRGLTPILIKDIQITATDTHTKQPLLTTHIPIDTSLNQDPIGKKRGTIVQ